MALIPKQQRFVDEYLVDLNAAAAYRRDQHGRVGSVVLKSGHASCRHVGLAAGSARRGDPRHRARSSFAEFVTHPTMPPWALIISSATRWNSGKYDPTQSSSTRQS